MENQQPKLTRAQKAEKKKEEEEKKAQKKKEEEEKKARDKIEKLEKELKEKLEKEEKKLREKEEKEEKKAQKKKEEAEGKKALKEDLKKTLKQKVINTAFEENKIELENEDIRIPSKYKNKEEDIRKLVNYAKKKYYTRTKHFPKKHVDLKQRIINTAKSVNGIDLEDQDIKIPYSSTMSDFETLLEYAKKKYYARTKSVTPFQREVLKAASRQGINEKYVKFRKNHKTMKNLINAAQKRRNKNTAKQTKTTLRQTILDYAHSTHGLDEKGLRSVICVKKKQ
jgi:hypothetical protein